MQLTIDSTEPLEYVLRVVGSLYGTELAIAAKPTESKAPEAKTTPARGRKRTRKHTATKGKRTRRPVPSTADIRTWAQEQGHQVATRGRLPGSIVRAYTDAHR